MGLSDSERRQGIYFAVNELTRIAQRWREDRDVRDSSFNNMTHIRDMLDGLWHTLLGSQTNGLHWIMGSSSSNQIHSEPRDPWAMAVSCRLSESRSEDNEWEDGAGDEDKPFDALKHTSIRYLVAHDRMDGKALAYVYETYQWIEQLIYYLRRYDDSFLQSGSLLSEAASRIMGACFNVFYSNEAFAKAYVIHDMMDILYGSAYPYRPEDQDFITKFMVDSNTHHDFTYLMQWELCELTEKHIALTQASVKVQATKGKDATAKRNLQKARLLTMIDMSKSLAEYKHHRSALENGMKLAKCKFIAEAKVAMDAAAKRFSSRKNDRKDSDEEERLLHSLDCYGYDGYSLISDMVEPLTKKVWPQRTRTRKPKAKKGK